MEKLLTVKETADILNLNYRTVLRLIDAGFLHSLKIGRTHRISQKEVEKFIHSADSENIIFKF